MKAMHGTEAPERPASLLLSADLLVQAGGVTDQFRAVASGAVFELLGPALLASCRQPITPADLLLETRQVR